jgi:hypothetical protein
MLIITFFGFQIKKCSDYFLGPPHRIHYVYGSESVYLLLNVKMTIADLR